MPDVDAHIGREIQRARLDRKMSQADLAAAMTDRGHSMHQQTILKIEKGMRPLRLAEALSLADVLSINLESLRQPNSIEERVSRLHEHYRDLGRALEAYLLDYDICAGLVREQVDQGVAMTSTFAALVRVNHLLEDDGAARAVLGALAFAEQDIERRTLHGDEIDQYLDALEEREEQLLARRHDGEHPEAP